jgi:hypothetical protein
VDRTQPLQITWTGGDPNGQVEVVGSSQTDNSGASVSFVCYAKDSDLQLSVPSAILSLLPVSGTIGGTPAGFISVGTQNSVTGTANGLDYLNLSYGTSFPKTGIAFK